MAAVEGRHAVRRVADESGNRARQIRGLDRSADSRYQSATDRVRIRDEAAGQLDYRRRRFIWERRKTRNSFATLSRNLPKATQRRFSMLWRTTSSSISPAPPGSRAASMEKKS